MRGLAGLPFIVILSMLAGCAGSAPIEVESPPDLRELGKPWPVKVGEFSPPLSVTSHDERAAIFTVGREDRETYRLDYTKRTLTKVSARPSALYQAGNGGAARIGRRGNRPALFVVGQDGDRVAIGETVLPAEGPGFAQTKDRSAIAFYESTPGGPQLVYYDQTTGSRAAWRDLPTPPVRARLGWSTGERYLVEALAGQLIVYDREAGLTIGSVAGTRPLFAPTDLYLLFQRADGRPGLLDLRSGYDWPILPASGKYRPLPAAAWTPDGSRVLIQAEATAQSGPDAPPFQLYLCSVNGAQQRYPLKAPLDLSRYAVLLQPAHPEVGRLLAIVPRLRNGPLIPLDATGYLVGHGRQLAFLDLAARLDPIRAFPGPVRELSLAGTGRRLVVVTGGQSKVQVYAWRLPELSALTKAFPDERDLMLGRLRLDMTSAEVLKVMGSPLDRERQPDPFAKGETLETLRYPETAATFARGHLVRLIDTASATATWRGIRIGSTKTAVYEDYGRPGYERADYLSYQGKVNGVEVKVAFQFGADRRVAAILVAKSGSETR